MAILTVTIKEELVINGADRGNTNSVDISVTQVDHRVLDVIHTAEQTLLLFDTAVAAGTIKDSTLNYLRITNLDSSNYVTLRILGDEEEYFVKVEAGDSFLLNNSVMDANATGGQAVSLANIDAIKVKADTATCSLEVFTTS